MIGIVEVHEDGCTVDESTSIEEVNAYLEVDKAIQVALEKAKKRYNSEKVIARSGSPNGYITGFFEPGQGGNVMVRILEPINE
jgi:hypothetical protein